MDLNKEIKLSDLFRRNKGSGGDDVPKAEKPPKEKQEKKERKSFSFSLSRGPKEPKEPKPGKEAQVSSKSAPAPPAVPLMRAFNLMPKESEREKSAASPAFLKVALALVAVLVLAALAGAYMMMSGSAKEKQARADDLRAQLAEIEAQATADQGPNTAALTAEGQARTAALSEALAARVAWDRILREFSLVLPEDVWLTTLSSSTPTAGAVPDPAAAGAGQSTFTIVGFATSQEAVATLLSRLEVIPEFASVQLQSSARGGGEDAEGGGATSGDPHDYSFTIVAGIAPNGVPAQ